MDVRLVRAAALLFLLALSPLALTALGDGVVAAIPSAGRHLPGGTLTIQVMVDAEASGPGRVGECVYLRFLDWTDEHEGYRNTHVCALNRQTAGHGEMQLPLATGLVNVSAIGFERDVPVQAAWGREATLYLERADRGDGNGTQWRLLTGWVGVYPRSPAYHVIGAIQLAALLVVASGAALGLRPRLIWVPLAVAFVCWPILSWNRDYELLRAGWAWMLAAFALALAATWVHRGASRHRPS